MFGSHSCSSHHRISSLSLSVGLSAQNMEAGELRCALDLDFNGGRLAELKVLCRYSRLPNGAHFQLQNFTNEEITEEELVVSGRLTYFTKHLGG